jgi:hypothetical protein
MYKKPLLRAEYLPEERIKELENSLTAEQKKIVEEITKEYWSVGKNRSIYGAQGVGKTLIARVATKDEDVYWINFSSPKEVLRISKEFKLKEDYEYVVLNDVHRAFDSDIDYKLLAKTLNEIASTCQKKEVPLISIFDEPMRIKLTSRNLDPYLFEEFLKAIGEWTFLPLSVFLERCEKYRCLINEKLSGFQNAAYFEVLGKLEEEDIPTILRANGILADEVGEISSGAYGDGNIRKTLTFAYCFSEDNVLDEEVISRKIGEKNYEIDETGVKIKVGYRHGNIPHEYISRLSELIFTYLITKDEKVLERIKTMLPLQFTNKDFEKKFAALISEISSGKKKEGIQRAVKECLRTYLGVYKIPFVEAENIEMFESFLEKLNKSRKRVFYINKHLHRFMKKGKIVKKEILKGVTPAIIPPEKFLEIDIEVDKTLRNYIEKVYRAI